MSFDEFLAFEDGAEFRHEYIGGVAYAMTGGTRAHNQIAGRLFARLLTAAGGGRVYVNDVLLRAGSAGFYPDLMLKCPAIEIAVTDLFA